MIEAMKLKTQELRKLDINTQEDAKKLFESVFYARKHYEDVISKTTLLELKEAYNSLKNSNLDYNEKIATFLSKVKGGKTEDLEDMAKEIVHFLEPEKYPIWTRWIWNKERGSGSITYILKDDVKIKSQEDFFTAVNELKNVLDIFGLGSQDYFYTTLFLVYAYVRYLDYTMHLAVDKKAAGLLPTHLTTTALVLGLKPYIKVIRLANS